MRRVLNQTLRELRLSKYNLDASPLRDLPAGHRILVTGQVEDDASVLNGCSATRTNVQLLARTRAQNPASVIIYKPHPDVDAALRAGRIEPEQALNYADMVLPDAEPIAMIERVDEVWTMTSLLGFEALIRGTPVTCLGTPFYAGWGLKTDLDGPVSRRVARPSLAGLVHACLIDYARYFDPVSGCACPVEVVVDRLAHGPIPAPGRLAGTLVRLQSLWAGLRNLRFEN